MCVISRKTLLCALLMIFLGCAHFVFAKDAASFRGEVNSSNINVRADSTLNSQVICALERKEKVEVISEFFEWYKIRLPKTAPSYIKKRFVACVDETPDNEPCRNARVISNRVNIRLRPVESSPILGEVNKTDPVVILGQGQGWYKIEPIVNSFGWIHKKFVTKLPPAPATETPAVGEQLKEPEKEEKAD